MPNLKSVKNRISTVKSTRKITQAMKMVAASKVRKAQVRVLNSRPYSRKLEDFILRAVQAIPEIDKKGISLMEKREVKSVGIIIISADRGLCGSYNTNIIKKATKRIIELRKQNIQPKLILVGNKANNFFKRANVEVIGTFTQLPAIPSVEVANLISSVAEKAFINKEIDQAEIIGTDFMSMLRFETYSKSFLPIMENDRSQESNSKSSTTVLFEPSLEVVLESIIPLYLSNVVYHALLEAVCSELASRMNAMASATNNARDLIDRLTLVYNKARQAAITQELAEIVGGAEALK